MITPTSDSPPGRGRATIRSRAGGMLIALLIEAVLIMGLLRLGLQLSKPAKPNGGMVTIQLTPPAKEKAAQAKTAPTKEHQTATLTKPKPHLKPPPVTIKPIKPPITFIEMSKDEFSASDISKYAHKADSGGGSSKPAYGPGEGPNGEPLYNAEWYREPTDGELAYYLPPNRPEGSWAIIACRTIENFHVDSCQSMGESPPGSGLAKAIRQAAWQFRVRPPHIGDKPQIGAWVRIRMDFRLKAEK